MRQLLVVTAIALVLATDAFAGIASLISVPPRRSGLSASRIGRRAVAAVLLALAVASTAGAAPRTCVITAHGIRLNVPAGWARVPPASAGAVVDPKTLLVVGTHGVTPKPSLCQIAAYRIPATGAVVVVVGWTSLRTSGASGAKEGRRPLTRLIRVRRPSFECFGGRGAAAGVVLHRKAYQVNVMVGARATPSVIEQALAVGRSFDLAR